MLDSLTKSYIHYFEGTPIEKLINLFSNDLGNLDLTLLFIIVQLIESILIVIVMIINVFEINPYLIAIGVVSIILLVLLFFYLKPIILEAKKLDLNTKNPIYHELNETIKGLI